MPLITDNWDIDNLGRSVGQPVCCLMGCGETVPLRYGLNGPELGCCREDVEVTYPELLPEGFEFPCNCDLEGTGHHDRDCLYAPSGDGMDEPANFEPED